jgi:hypothetical protein
VFPFCTYTLLRLVGTFSLGYAMDNFTFNTTYRIWICTICQHGVIPQQVRSHITSNKRHRSCISAKKRSLPAEKVEVAVAEAWAIKPWDPTISPFIPPPPDSGPIPGLPVYTGYGCPEAGCIYAARKTEVVRAHQRKVHGWKGRHGRPDPMYLARNQYPPVFCQRMFVMGEFSRFFIVTPAKEARRAREELEMS